jgi:hypothetical protein
MHCVPPQAKDSPDIRVLSLLAAVSQAAKIPEIRPRCVVTSGSRSIVVHLSTPAHITSGDRFGDAFDLIDEITEQSVDLS